LKIVPNDVSTGEGILPTSEEEVIESYEQFTIVYNTYRLDKYENLDKRGGVSHPYHWTLIRRGTLEYNNIMNSKKAREALRKVRES
jgi:hypothetical protein